MLANPNPNPNPNPSPNPTPNPNPNPSPNLNLQDVDIGGLPIAALVHDPDLIELPRFAGLPHIESITIPHKFAASDWVYRICLSPWGPFPGVEDYHNLCMWDLIDAPSTDEGQFMWFAESPLEGATSHRGWPVPELEPRRKRNILHGCTIHVWAEGEGTGSLDAPRHAERPGVG